VIYAFTAAKCGDGPLGVRLLDDTGDILVAPRLCDVPDRGRHGLNPGQQQACGVGQRSRVEAIVAQQPEVSSHIRELIDDALVGLI